MLAFVYLFFIFMLGDGIGRRFSPFISIQHRLASAFLTGLLFSTCFTYLVALLFSSTSQPLVWSNLCFFAVSAGIIFLLRRGVVREQPGDGSLKRIYDKIFTATASDDDDADVLDVQRPLDISAPNETKTPIVFDADRRPAGNAKWDWLVLCICSIFGCWLMFATLDFNDGSFKFAIKAWSDFGANISLSQSMALGNNFPTEHPFFPGETIRYHFLFWFQSANLSFLGLNIVRSINLLSIVSLTALLVLIMTLAEVIFNSRIVARISAILFFFGSTSLTYIPFLLKQPSIAQAFSSIIGSTNFLDSGYPFHGETWGGLPVNVFAYQRHLIAGTGIFLLVVVFLIDLYRRKGSIATLGIDSPVVSDDHAELSSSELNDSAPEVFQTADDDLSLPDNEPPETVSLPVYVEEKPKLTFRDFRGDIAAFIISGIMIGILPYFNSAVFVAAMVVIGGLLVFFPLRRYLLILLGVAIIVGLPQILMLQSGNVGRTTSSLFNWGYIVVNPTIPLVLEYIVWTFGLKLLLFPIALWFLPGTHRRLFLVFSGLFVVVFVFQLSTDPFNNHKLLNVWTILVSPYIAYALWLIGKDGIHRAILAVVIGLLLVFSSIVDLFPLHNDGFVSTPFQDDRLTSWIFENTQPQDVFLSDKVLSHPIVFAGRKVYLGNTLLAWGAGYDLQEREKNYGNMFSERNPQVLFQMLNESHISYVAIDDGLRRSKLITNINEEVYRQNFERVFEDPERRYGDLNIYRVPIDSQGLAANPFGNTENRPGDETIPTVTAFEQKPGNGRGQLSVPRGIAVDKDGNFYVTDTGNSRVQKFAANGTFVSVIGNAGSNDGELREPNGIAIDKKGNLFVTDALNHRLLSFNSKGKFVKQWDGGETKFFGPRAVAIGPDEKIYVLDQGNSRIVMIDPKTETTRQWGGKGAGDGEFAEPTGLEVTKDRVYVTDAANDRIQVFDLNGKFLAQWPVPEWTKYPWHYPDILSDPKNNRLYVTSPIAKEIMVFDTEGNRLEPITPPDKTSLENPSGLAVMDSNSGSKLYVVNTGSSNIYAFDLLN